MRFRNFSKFGCVAELFVDANKDNRLNLKDLFRSSSDGMPYADKKLQKATYLKIGITKG